MSKQNQAIAIILSVLILLLVTSSIPPARAQFVLSGWASPNEYGEGIYTFILSENSTGDWVDFGYSAASGNFLIGQKVLNWSDWANQGVTQDGTYVYTTNATIVMKYTKGGTFQYDHDSTADSGLATLGLAGLCYYDGHIYIAAHNADSSNSTVLKYNTSLVFEAEYDVPEPTVSNNVGAGGISYHDGYFWTVSDSQTDHADFQITQYDLDMVLVEAFAVEGFDIVDSWHYQGLDWYNDFILCNVHEGSNPQRIDVYQFSGTGFNQIGRMQQPSYDSDGTVNWMSQDISIENDAGTYYIWFASRRATDAENEIAKYRLLVDSSSTFDIDVNTGIKLDIRVTLNYTRLGLVNPDDIDLGLNYMRLNATVTVLETAVFTEANLTYNSLSGLFQEGVWWYSYTLTLIDVFIDYGTIYTVTVTYEIFG